MSRTMSDRVQAVGLLALLGAAPLAAADTSPKPRPSPTPRPPVRVYTNADLERVHPFAAETGGRSTPAYPAGDEETRPTRPALRGRGEAYWRQQAARVRERLRALEERAAGLRSRIAEHEQRRKSAVYGRSGRAAAQAGSDTPLRAQLEAVEHRMRKTREDLEDRARRDGALPGWLR